MSFGKRMNTILAEQETAANKSPNEIYHECLEGCVEQMLKQIEYDVVNHGSRKGRVCLYPIKNQYKKTFNTHLVFTSNGYLVLQPILELTRREEGKFLSKAGTVHFTIDFSPKGRKIFDDLKALLKKEGVSVQLGFNLNDNDYDTTTDFTGVLKGLKPYTFSIPVANIKDYHLNKSVTCMLEYSIDKK